MAPEEEPTLLNRAHSELLRPSVKSFHTSGLEEERSPMNGQVTYSLFPIESPLFSHLND